ncbi:hypothetical protein [Actinacidiphila rubida]|uniref:hypothetical protein n=1 Tax=Actinacidiphila rubida TaxID=310780 RepID=UPI001160E200|nr:hypothetical protein [Actinacidiphila rubida]
MSDILSTLLGAGAVVAGAGLAGGFTLLKGRQESADKERERLEQRVARHREIRRDAYVDFLSKIHLMDLAQREVNRTENRNLSESALLSLASAERSLYQSLLVVRMEGPTEVAEAARALVRAFRQLNGLLEDGLTLETVEANMREREATRDAFLASAARTLGTTP